MGRNKQVYRVAILSLMIALCHVGRLAFSFLPNVQPVTVIVLIITLVMGTVDGLIVGNLSILLSNLTLGMGTWTFAQLMSYSLLVLITGLIRRYRHSKGFYWMFTVYAGISGYLYGLTISLVQAPFFGIKRFLPYYLAGLPFDTLHAVGNAVFYILLAPVLLPLLEKGKIRFH